MASFLFNPIFLTLLLTGNGVAAYFYKLWLLNGIVALVITALMVLQFLQLGWEDSNPNEWLLVIQNGKMVKAGVGLRCFRLWNQTVVRFPSQIQKVQFSAMQVTREMQGVEIKGIAIWGIDRTVQTEGPFKYYKNMTNASSDTNVRQMCESIVRHIISNTELDKVLKDRDQLHEAMRKELQQQLSGWGVWLETVEITDIRICSRTLFEDLQARFKQDEYLKAEKIRLETTNKIEENRMLSELSLAQQRERQQTERTRRDNEQNLKRCLQDFKFYEQNMENQIKRIEQEKVIELEQNQINHEYSLKEKKQQLELAKLKFLNELDTKKQQLELENSMSDINFQKYQIDRTKEILQGLPLQNFRVVNYVTEDNSGLRSFLPGINDFYQAIENLASKQDAKAVASSK